MYYRLRGASETVVRLVTVERGIIGDSCLFCDYFRKRVVGQMMML